MKRSIEYISHTCSHSECPKAFIERDLFNDQDTAPNRRYCPECAKKFNQIIPKNLINNKKFLNILYEQATKWQLQKHRPIAGHYKTILKEANEIFNYFEEAA